MASDGASREEAPGWLEQRDDAKGLTLNLGGRWDLACAERLERALRDLAASPARVVRIDLTNVTGLDTAGAWLLHRLVQRLRERGIDAGFAPMRESHADLLERLAKLEGHFPMEPPRRNAIGVIVGRVGEGMIAVTNEAVESISFLGLATVQLGGLLVRPKGLRLSAVFTHLEQAGLNAIPIVALLSFLIGVVIAFQGAIQLRQFGAEIFVVDLVAVSILRELAVLLTAIIVAGRSGSAFTAQIGSMKINEEIDAMQTLGLNPFQVLVLPRLIAMAIALPLLCFLADVMGLMGGGVMAMIELGISPAQYLDRLDSAVKPWSVGVGLIKAPVFAGVIALTGCYMGLKVAGSAESVGKLTTRAVVHAIFMVIVIDAIFSIFFAYIGI